MKERIHIISLGCPKNLVDSEVMAAALEKGGFRVTDEESGAHIILVNTCTFIRPAQEESIDVILRAASLKEQGRCRYLIVAGCLPQRYGAILEKELPEVDLFIGTGEVPRITELTTALVENGRAIPRCVVGRPDFLMTRHHPRLLPGGCRSAYLKIAEGCSNRCSYCVVPLVRGGFRSREPDDIVKEAAGLAVRGIREIILTAQETTAWGADLKGKPALPTLMRELASVDGIAWIRLLYTYPGSVSTELLETIAGEEKICDYIDIPIQHIDDDILKMMGRRDRESSIRAVIARARDIIPSVALRTSLIVGFPGEGRAQFRKLRDFARETRFDHLGVFTYSREEGTKAAGLPRQVTQRTKDRRRGLIMEEQAEISREINETLVGTRQEILIEEPSDIPGYDHVGRLRRQAPDIDGVTYMKGGGRTGDIVLCEITAADVYDLHGKIINNP
ncbi:MAG: 30S ribosomal protein S12 methylthiotransferase RimO [Deltaproteobacteria bacterium]|nr:30S ribosomal protein S12 methylthiotransferase RimO [Deltaproteobacteria bacterium]